MSQKNTTTRQDYSRDDSLTLSEVEIVFVSRGFWGGYSFTKIDGQQCLYFLSCGFRDHWFLFPDCISQQELLPMDDYILAINFKAKISSSPEFWSPLRRRACHAFLWCQCHHGAFCLAMERYFYSIGKVSFSVNAFNRFRQGISRWFACFKSNNISGCHQFMRVCVDGEKKILS